MNKNFFLNKYSRNINDTGSPEIQIIIITYKINKLNFHLKKNPKDYISKRRLLILISKRLKLIFFLKKENNILYFKLLNDLNIKFN